MDRWLIALPVLVGWYMMLRVLDLDQVASEWARDWWRRVRWTGRHSRSGQRVLARERSRRAEEQDRAWHEAMDRVWVSGLAEWAARARGDGLDRGQVAVRWI
jgi:hypothetical protein